MDIDFEVRTLVERVRVLEAENARMTEMFEALGRQVSGFAVEISEVVVGLGEVVESLGERVARLERSRP